MVSVTGSYARVRRVRGLRIGARCVHLVRSQRMCARRARLERSMRKYRPCVGRVVRRAQLVGLRRVGFGRGLSRDSRVARTQRIR
jgi:hypothetical protein